MRPTANNSVPMAPSRDEEAVGVEEFRKTVYGTNLVSSVPRRPVEYRDVGHPGMVLPAGCPCHRGQTARELPQPVGWACGSDGNSGDAIGSLPVRETPGMHPPRVGGGCFASEVGFRVGC